MINFVLGLFVGTMLLEPIIINFIYMSNPGLFLDIVLSEKNRNKLKDEFIFEEELDKRWHKL